MSEARKEPSASASRRISPPLRRARGGRRARSRGLLPHDPRPRFFRGEAGAIVRPIIYDDDLVHGPVGAEVRHDGSNGGALVVGGDDDGNAKSLIHGALPKHSW